jgi:CHAT domain-containing protein
VLSLWKVDDSATSLLMARFYQNLLGNRPGLKQPMPKAKALDEAKRWLRGLSAEEAGAAQGALDRGPLRPLATEGGAPGRPAPRPASSGPRPYEHPYDWAAFVLIGDPN